MKTYLTLEKSISHKSNYDGSIYKSYVTSFFLYTKSHHTINDFFDEEGHMLGELADRYSDILASVLLDKCDKSTAFYGTYAQLEQAVYENYVTNQ